MLGIYQGRGRAIAPAEKTFEAGAVLGEKSIELDSKEQPWSLDERRLKSSMSGSIFEPYIKRWADARRSISE
jgi:hypothetical protein